MKRKRQPRETGFGQHSLIFASELTLSANLMVHWIVFIGSKLPQSSCVGPVDATFVQGEEGVHAGEPP